MPDSWEEFCKDNPLKIGESWITGSSSVTAIHDIPGGERSKQWYNLLPNKEYAEAILALCQLIQLRDCYRQGWKPDWSNSARNKSCILFRREQVQRDFFCENNQILSFQSADIRDKFYNNFKDLIKKTKPLFM